eukprot:GGOE01020556.1.p1 GENE.GGOE01020556.1~~GGOE01020556.1.p1  ORF type:complete len:416 (-),score=127.28 GGOE01020556.1:343-1590(-)
MASNVRGNVRHCVAAMALAGVLGVCCGAALSDRSTQLFAVPRTVNVFPSFATSSANLPLSAKDVEADWGPFGEHTPPSPHMQAGLLRARAVEQRDAPEAAGRSTPALLAGFLIAGTILAVVWRSLQWRLHSRWLSPSHSWASMSCAAERPQRFDSTLAAASGDFDGGLLHGSGWNNVPLSGQMSLDDIPPSDNSGFRQSGGFGWNEQEQGYDHISRRMQQRHEQELQQMAEEEKEVREHVVQQVTERRTARVLPRAEDPPQVVLDYLLSIVTDDLAFEITRVRPLITDAFHALLDEIIEAERKKEEAESPAEDAKPVTMLRNYMALKKLIEVTLQKIDTMAAVLTAPKDRLKKLLSAPDKRAAMLEMVASNEVDEELLQLLKTNQASAQLAGAQQVADFLGKLHDECQRFVGPAQ